MEHGGAALLLGLSPKGEDHGADRGYGDDHKDDGGDEPNHEFDAAAADAFHAAKSDDLEGFRKALYNAVCAVVDEEESEEGDGGGDEG